MYAIRLSVSYERSWVWWENPCELRRQVYVGQSRRQSTRGCVFCL